MPGEAEIVHFDKTGLPLRRISFTNISYEILKSDEWDKQFSTNPMEEAKGGI